MQCRERQREGHYAYERDRDTEELKKRRKTEKQKQEEYKRKIYMSIKKQNKCDAGKNRKKEKNVLKKIAHFSHIYDFPFFSYAFPFYFSLY